MVQTFAGSIKVSNNAFVWLAKETASCMRDSLFCKRVYAEKIFRHCRFLEQSYCCCSELNDCFILFVKPFQIHLYSTAGTLLLKHAFFSRPSAFLFCANCPLSFSYQLQLSFCPKTTRLFCYHLPTASIPVI